MEKTNTKPQVTFSTFMNNHEELERIASIVSESYGIPIEVLKSRTRRREVLIPRQVIMDYAYKTEELTQKYIGNYFNRDHSTVINAIQQVSDLYETNKTFKRNYDQLGAIIYPMKYNFEVYKKIQNEA